METVPFSKEHLYGRCFRSGRAIATFPISIGTRKYNLDPKTRELAQDEIGDVFIFLVYLADILGIDPIEAAHQKLAKADQKYPKLYRAKKK